MQNLKLTLDEINAIDISTLTVEQLAIHFRRLQIIANVAVESKINPDLDLWKQAQEFTKQFVSDKLETDFRDYCVKQEFNKNEAMLFKQMCNSAVELHYTCAIIKQYS